MASGGRSTGAERDVSSLEELLQCPICIEPFTVPKVLSCHHTFCEKCLQDMYNANEQSGRLRCPTCRERSFVPPNGIAGLPNDFRANDLKDKIRKMKSNVSNPSQPRPLDNVCNPCQASKKVVPATWRCTDCDMLYCEACVACHNSNSIFKDHEVRTICPKCEVRLKLVLHLVGQTVQSYSELWQACIIMWYYIGPILTNIVPIKQRILEHSGVLYVLPYTCRCYSL